MLQRDFLRALEATLVGFFFVQTIRFLYTQLYARVSSADLVGRVDYEAVKDIPGVVEVSQVQLEIYAVIAILLAPLLALVLYRLRWSLPFAVAICVVGRLLALQLPENAVLAAAVTVAAGFLYMTLVIIRRPSFFPVMLAMGFALDQFIRALNSTTDPTFNENYEFVVFGSPKIPIVTAMAALAIFTLFLTALTTFIEGEEAKLPNFERPIPGVLSGWGALAFGGILYLEFTVLGLPNVVARWANVDYYWVLPLVMLATLMPLVPEVRAQAGRFISIFDAAYRGWLWALILALMLIIGKRFEGAIAAGVLSLAQLFTVLTMWWLIQQNQERRRVNPSPILILVSALVFIVLSVGDYFTYDYAYVRDISPPFSFLEDILRGMRDMGLPLAVAAAILACLPMILERQIIPWREGQLIRTLVTAFFVLIITISATRAAVPNPVRPPANPACLRAVTLNIHSGYTQYFAQNLELVAETIATSGADVVLLQEIETGRLSSGSTDQAIWLANKLNMNATFFPQNEDLQGIAVLSRLPIANAEGAELTSEGPQAAVQYVRYQLAADDELHVYNMWLGFEVESRDGQPVPDEQQDQALQMNEVYNLVAQHHFLNRTEPTQDRVLLGGTFNFGEASPLYTLWKNTVFNDPFTTLFTENRDTLFLVDGTAARYDYLWMLNLEATGISIDQNNTASDHRPSVLGFSWIAGQTCS